ncbi:MAG: hypothetical protein KF799_04250 [Bdellovibrionales bacterium]|nr:hypothetical protein [Bdellovibrionales bacterium]
MIRFLISILAALFMHVIFATPAFAYETCTAQNSYLEAMLPNVIDDSIPSALPEQCVEAAQASLAPTGYYGFCPTADGAPGRTHPRPCLSRKYVGTVHSALVAVADCLDFDPRLAFATFNLESAVHLNAVGAATDVGVGQLTKSAIDEVTLNALDRARKMATSSSKPSCQKILPYMTAHSSEKAKRCGFMHLPENPWRNLVYSILLMQQNRKAVDRYWTRLNIQVPADVHVEQLKEHLTHLAYNAGSAGGMATLAAYTELMGPRASDRLFNFESQDFYSFARFMGRSFPVGAGKESTRKRISKYVFYVAQAARRVERLAGVQCFDPLTFPPYDPTQPVVFNSPPDFSRALDLTESKLLTLARDFKSGQKSNLSCAAKRARFVYEFVPSGLQPEDLPIALLQVYRTLCD